MKKNQANKKLAEKLAKSSSIDHFKLLEESSKLADSGVPRHVEKYVEHFLDPANFAAEPAPVMGGYTGMVGVEDLKCDFSLPVGSANYGALMVDPFTSAACADRAVAWNYTESSAVVPAWGLPYTTDAQTTVHYPFATRYAAGFNSNNVGTMFSAKPNACAIYIRPESSVLDQNGMLYLLEIPLHPLSGGSSGNKLTVESVLNHRRTRVLSAVSLNSNQYVNCLNYHIQDGVSNSDDMLNNGWSAPTGATFTASRQALAVVVTGTPGTVYNIQVRGSWLTKGVSVDANRVQLANPICAAALANTAIRKRISGWSGPPDVIIKLFKAALHKQVRILVGQGEVEKAKALVEESSGSKPSAWSHVWTAAKKLAPIAGELLGLAI